MTHKIENGETQRKSGTKNLERGVAPSPVGSVRPGITGEARKVPSPKVHAR